MAFQFKHTFSTQGVSFFSTEEFREILQNVRYKEWKNVRHPATQKPRVQRFTPIENNYKSQHQAAKMCSLWSAHKAALLIKQFIDIFLVLKCLVKTYYVIIYYSILPKTLSLSNYEGQVQIMVQWHDLILLAEYQDRVFQYISLQPVPSDYFLLEYMVFCLSLHVKYCSSSYTHSVHPCRTDVPLPAPKGCCQNLLMCMWQTWEHIKAQRPAQQKPWPCFFSLAVSALRESKRRHKALSVSAVCLDLTLVYVWVPVCVCVHECMCTDLCGEPHQRTTEWLSCYDLWPWHAPRQREGGGEEKDTVKHTHTHIHIHTHKHKHIHKKKGGIHTTASKFTTAKKTTMDRDVAICLVSFYRDLWAGTHK